MDKAAPPPSNILWTCAGLCAFGIGFIGIFLPLLPTTPLVLLAAFCFGKGSPRLRTWLLSHKRFGPMIQDWQDRGAISSSAKRAAAVAMAITFLIAVFLGLPLWVLAVQALCLGGAATFVLTRPSA